MATHEVIRTIDIVDGERAVKTPTLAKAERPTHDVACGESHILSLRLRACVVLCKRIYRVHEHTAADLAAVMI